jgi:hypothetical protein
MIDVEDVLTSCGFGAMAERCLTGPVDGPCHSPLDVRPIKPYYVLPSHLTGARAIIPLIESSLQGRSCNVARSDALGKGCRRPRCLTASSRCELQVPRVSIVIGRLLSMMPPSPFRQANFLSSKLLFVIARLIDRVGSTRTDRAQEGVCPTPTLPFLHSCVPHSSCRYLHRLQKQLPL